MNTDFFEPATATSSASFTISSGIAAVKTTNTTTTTTVASNCSSSLRKANANANANTNTAIAPVILANNNNYNNNNKNNNNNNNNSNQHKHEIYQPISNDLSNEDNGDTSFEIDDPDDEEVIGSLIITSKPPPSPLSTNACSTKRGVVGAAMQQTVNSSANLLLADSAQDATLLRIQQATNSYATTTNDANCSRHHNSCSSSFPPRPPPPSMSSTICQTCTAGEACTIIHSIPLVAIRDDPGDEQSDVSIESDTGSSTPTTADIADFNTLASSPYPASATATTNNKCKQRLPLQHAKMMEVAALDAKSNSSALVVVGAGFGSSNNGSIAEDNLSGSIATTTTDVDIDNITVASPNMSLTATTTRLHVSHCNAVYSPQSALNSPAANATAASAVASTSISVQRHPSAAFLQSDTRQSDAISSTLSHKRTLSSTSYRSTTSQHPSLAAVSVHSVHSRFYNWIRWMCLFFKSSGIGEPSVYHALVVIFLEFFAWGLLTMPVISVLNQTFPDHTFLMNGLVMGIKGILSFLSAPLIGALSDIWGRKFFLLITVFFTCAPIPLMTINSWWFFAMISISGIFAVTFSVVFAYVADVTTVEERSRAYGLVSATFAASLVISPALGAALMEMYSDTLVVALATAIAVLDVFFILVAVPESLPEKVRPSSWGAPISWEQADPFAALRKVGTDHTILMQCVTVLLSYLPEAGQYSCIFVYLKLKMGFNSMEVAIFIAVVGILSISIQVTLGYLMRVLGAKRTIILGLVLEMLQLLWYGFGSQKWMMWAAGVLAALGSITYPAISAFVSIHSTPDRQGAVQGMVTGMRGLCNGLGPAMFGVIFYLFNVDLNDEQITNGSHDIQNETYNSDKYAKFIPGPPFVFGALMVILAILVAIFIPDGRGEIAGLSRAPSEKKRISLDVQYEIETGHKATGPLAPLMRSDSLAQL